MGRWRKCDLRRREKRNVFEVGLNECGESCKATSADIEIFQTPAKITKGSSQRNESQTQRDVSEV